MSAAYTRQYKWLARMEDIELLPREVPDCNSLMGAEMPSDEESGMVFTPEKVKKSAAREKREVIVPDPDEPAKKTRKTPGMISITGNRRLLLLTIARACDANTGKTHASRKTLIARAGLDEGGSTYDECTHDLQAAGLLRISWEYFPRGSRRWWHVEDDRLRLLVGSGIDPQILKDAVKAIVDGAVMAHVYPSPARIDQTKRRLRGVANEMEHPAKLNIAVAYREDDKEHKKPDLIITLNTGVTPVDVDDADEEANSEAIEHMDLTTGETPASTASAEAPTSPLTPEQQVTSEYQMVTNIRDRLYAATNRSIPALDSRKDIDSFNAIANLAESLKDEGGLVKMLEHVAGVVEVALETKPFWRKRLIGDKVECPAVAFVKYFESIDKQYQEKIAKAQKKGAPAPAKKIVPTVTQVQTPATKVYAMGNSTYVDAENNPCDKDGHPLPQPKQEVKPEVKPEQTPAPKPKPKPLPKMESKPILPPEYKVRDFAERMHKSLAERVGLDSAPETAKQIMGLCQRYSWEDVATWINFAVVENKELRNKFLADCNPAHSLHWRFEDIRAAYLKSQEESKVQEEEPEYDPDVTYEAKLARMEQEREDAVYV